MIKTAKTKRILQHASRAITQERIQATRFQLNALNVAAFKLHLKLAKEMSSADWDLFSRILYARVNKEFKSTKERQKRKFDHLQRYVDGRSKEDDSRAVINLSSKQIDPAVYSALSRGLNFAVTPTTIPYKRYYMWSGSSISGVATSSSRGSSG